MGLLISIHSIDPVCAAALIIATISLSCIDNAKPCVKIQPINNWVLPSVLAIWETANPWRHIYGHHDINLGEYKQQGAFLPTTKKRKTMKTIAHRSIKQIHLTNFCRCEKERALC